MIKTILICILVILFILPIAQSAIDTSPHTSLSTQIKQKEVEILDANNRGDFDSVVRIGKELESLNAQLHSPQMSFLSLYSDVFQFFQEAEYISDKYESMFPGEPSDALSSYESLSLELSHAESYYQTQDYENASLSLNDISQSIQSLPASLVTDFSTAVNSLRSNLQRTSQVTSSSLSMLEGARTKFNEASRLYSRASEGGPDVTEQLTKSHEVFDEGYDLLTRASQKGEDFSSVIWILVLGPIILILALLAYFYTQFKKQAITCSVSKNSILAGRGNEIERRITVSNPEKEIVYMTIVDSPPSNVTASDFDIEPEQVSHNDLIWGLEIAPEKIKILSYKFRIPPLEKGESVVLPAPTMTYEINGKEKKISGKTTVIKVI